MVVRNEGQALCVAVEMEKRAIRVYERALMLSDCLAMAMGLDNLPHLSYHNRSGTFDSSAERGNQNDP